MYDNVLNYSTRTIGNYKKYLLMVRLIFVILQIYSRVYLLQFKRDRYCAHSVDFIRVDIKADNLLPANFYLNKI